MSVELLEQYRDLHRHGAFHGTSLAPHIPRVRQLCEKYGPVRTILDYGSGKGICYDDGLVTWPAEVVRLYDPAVPELSEVPSGLYDGVVCTDVAEHLPEDEIDGFLKTLFGHARKFVFLTVCTRPARKNLPDGRNCHLTVKPIEWWAKRLRGALPPAPRSFVVDVVFTV